MKIIDFSPTSVGPNDEITIRLANMPKNVTQEELIVLVCGMHTLTNVKLVDEASIDTFIIATVTDLTHSGEITVSIYQDDIPSVTEHSIEPLIVCHQDERPVIESVTPEIITSSKQILTIKGRNFSDIQFVKCAGVELYEFTLSNGSQIQLTLPLHLIENGQHRISINSESLGSFYSPSHTIIKKNKE